MTDIQTLSPVHTPSNDAPSTLALDADSPTCSPPDSTLIVPNRGQKARLTAKFVRVRTQLDRLIARALAPLFADCNMKITFRIPECGCFDGRVSRWLIEGDLIDITEVSYDVPGFHRRGIPLLNFRVGLDTRVFEMSPHATADAQALAATVCATKMLTYLYEHLITLEDIFGNDQYWALKCAEEWLNTTMVTKKLQSFVRTSN